VLRRGSIAGGGARAVLHAAHELGAAGDDAVEDGAHLPLQRRQPLLQLPARRRQLLCALRDLARALLADDHRLFFLLLLEQAVEVSRGSLHGLHLGEEPNCACSFLFPALPLLRNPVLDRGHGARPLRLLRRRHRRVDGRGRPVLARHGAHQRPHGEHEQRAHGVEGQAKAAPRSSSGGLRRRRREVRRHGVHVAPGRPVLGHAERERPHGPRGGGGDLVGVVREDPGDGPARPGEVRAVQGGRQQARRRGQRRAVRAPERREREGGRVQDVERLHGAVEEVGGEAVGGRPGERGGDGGQGEHVAEDRVGGGDGVEELGEERYRQERKLRLRLRGEERGEAVGDMGLEGVQGEELVVLSGVEGGHGGGAAAEAQHAEEARGRRGVGGGHERSVSVVVVAGGEDPIVEGRERWGTVSYIYTHTRFLSPSDTWAQPLR
jgi:hypothetical protein